MESLPDELWYYQILPYLSLYDSCRLRNVSKLFDLRVRTYFSLKKSLDLQGLYNIIDEEGFGYIAVYLKSLQYINFTRCWNVATEKNIRLVANRCKNLKVFISNDCGEVTDDVIYELASRCPQISFLNISKCYKLTDQAVDSICEFLPNIEELYIASNYGIKDASMIKLSKICLRLRKLDVGKCLIRGSSLDGFVNSHTSLEEIRLTKCRYLGSTIVERMVKKGIVVNTCF